MHFKSRLVLLLLCGLHVVALGCINITIIKGEETEQAADAGTADRTSRADSGPSSASDGGEDPGFQYGNAASATFLQGSWRSPIKHTSAEPIDDDGTANYKKCDQESGWASNDVGAMLETFQETNQNLYIQHMFWSEIDDTSCDWKNLEALADEAESTGWPLTLWAGYASKKSMTYYEAAIQSLINLKASGPAVEGMLIDDFHLRVYDVLDPEKPTGYFDRGDVQDLYASLHAADHEDGGPVEAGLGFYPYVAAHSIPDLIVPAAIMGVRGKKTGSESPGPDHRLYPEGDTLEADRPGFSINFNLSPEEARGTWYLRFMHYDPFTMKRPTENDAGVVEDKDIYLVAEINGVRVFDESLSDEKIEGVADYVKAPSILLDDDVALYSEQPNELKMWVEARVNPYPNWEHKLAYVWDAHLKSTAGQKISLKVDDMVFDAYRDPERDVGTEHLIAASNANWRIDKYIDGVVFKDKASPAIYDEEVHARLLESTCGYLNAQGKLCIETYWGNEQWNENVFEMEDIPGRFERAQLRSDGFVVWRLENSLSRPSHGVYTERDPLSPDEYDVMAAFPQYLSGLPGWHQTWTLTDTAGGGDYQLEWWDNGGATAITAEEPERMVKELYVGGELEWSDPIIRESHETGENAENSGTFSFAVGAGDEIQLGMSLYNSFGTQLYLAQFRLIAPNGDVVDLSEAVFASSTDDEALQSMYDCTVAYYSSHDYEAACAPE